MAVPSFPQIVALCGAQTPLGQTLLRDLLNSEQVDKVYAIATEELSILPELPPAVQRKAVVSYTAADRLDLALSRIPECDIAFCVMTTGRHDFDRVGRSNFHAINVNIPVRFIQKMFHLGVLHISVLSYVNADTTSRSEFCKAKGELEHFIREIRREAADFSPLISIFRLPSLDGGSASRASSKERRPAGPDIRLGLQLEHVSAAMQIDAFGKANQRRASSPKARREFFEAADIPLLLQAQGTNQGYW